MKAFLIGLLLCLIVAFYYPEFGAEKWFGWMVKNVGVSIIFLRSGLEIETSKLRESVENWRVSGGILAFHFVFCPMLFKVAATFFGKLNLLSPGLVSGVGLVGVLPPPISSAVIITTVAGGNVALSIVASTLGSLAGVVCTPLLLVAVTGVKSEVSAGVLVTKLGTTVLFPLIIGQLGRRIRAPKIPSAVGKGILLAIIFHVFSRTFLKPLPISVIDVNFLVICVLLVQILLLIILGTATFFLFKQSPKDVIALMFSGSHKSLTLGMPILMSMYGEVIPAHIVLPLLVYHPAQIIVGSILAPQMLHFVDIGKLSDDSIKDIKSTIENGDDDDDSSSIDTTINVSKSLTQYSTLTLSPKMVTAVKRTNATPKFDLSDKFIGAMMV
jgi:sodium/bile acid cotransporter 7